MCLKSGSCSHFSQQATQIPCTEVTPNVDVTVLHLSDKRFYTWKSPGRKSTPAYVFNNAYINMEQFSNALGYYYYLSFVDQETGGQRLNKWLRTNSKWKRAGPQNKAQFPQIYLNHLIPPLGWLPLSLRLRKNLTIFLKTKRKNPLSFSKC